MPVKEINKKLFECTCVYPECPHHTKPWFTDAVPERCAGCKRRTWNRPARISSREPLTFNGETMTIAQWSRNLGLAKTTIPWRIKQGWPMEQVLTNEDWRFKEEGS